MYAFKHLVTVHVDARVVFARTSLVTVHLVITVYYFWYQHMCRMKLLISDSKNIVQSNGTCRLLLLGWSG